ncbi:hypothetical protein GCM10011297_21540 [Bacterioplanes sanyensis]|uniref:TonB-dependent receptor domain-containing protein n=1 Tax=Bacterioplanes sanyensis TaxID=1249553 RepID=UPI0016796B59|nr:TonB-dependent receptor [Bacterioplanes sanyensis]GGY48297.1 hypothetical protein GCM10011297_21540 [Bacterioplanes sanyensis]
MRWLALLLICASPYAMAQVYSARDFAPHLPETLLDMLQLLPGVSLSGASEQRRIQVSGTPSGQTRLLIDGVAMTDEDGSGQSLAAQIPAAAVASIELNADHPDALSLGSAIIRVRLHDANSTPPGGELRQRITGPDDGAVALRWNSRRQQLQLMHSGSRFDDQQTLFSSHQRWNWQQTDFNARWLLLDAEQPMPTGSSYPQQSYRLQLHLQRPFADLQLNSRLTYSHYHRDSVGEHNNQQWLWQTGLQRTTGEHRWRWQLQWQHEERQLQHATYDYRLRSHSAGMTLADNWQLSRDWQIDLGYRLQTYQHDLQRQSAQDEEQQVSDTHWLPYLHLRHTYDEHNQLHWQLGQYSQHPSARQRLASDDTLLGNASLGAEVLNRMQLSWHHQGDTRQQWQLRWLRQTWHNSLVAERTEAGRLQPQNSDEVQQLQGYEWQWQDQYYLHQQSWRLSTSVGFYRWRGRLSLDNPTTRTTTFSQARAALVNIVTAQLRWAADWQWQSRSRDHSVLTQVADAPAGYRLGLSASWLPKPQWHINARLGYHRPGLMSQTANKVGQYDWHFGLRFRW